MNSKKVRLFLWISFIIFALSVIAVVLSMIVSYYKVKTDFPNDNMRVTNELVAMVIVSVCVIIPAFGSELSLIRSIYKILKHAPIGYVKVCYSISYLLAFLALAFLCLMFFGLISFVGEGGQNYAVYVLMFTEWPAFMLSFILGSIPIKHDD